MPMCCPWAVSVAPPNSVHWVMVLDRCDRLGSVVRIVRLSLVWAAASAVLGAGSVLADDRAKEEPLPVDVEVGGITIEATRPKAEPSIDELLEHFRQRLSTERLLAPMERPLAGGLVEVNTRFGRFCVPSPSAFNWSDLTGSFALASFCGFY